jgi:hypothetical protein
MGTWTYVCSSFVPLAAPGVSLVLSRCGYGGEPVWFPWGSGPMGTAQARRRGDPIVTPWPDRAASWPGWQGHWIAFQGLARTQAPGIMAG